MAYGGGMGYHLHMPSYFWRTFTEYPVIKGKIAHRDTAIRRIYNENSVGFVSLCVSILDFLLNHSLYYIDDIVAQFLTFAYHIHVIDAILVLITFGIDILDIP